MNDLEKKVLRIASQAVKAAQRQSLEQGIPNVYSKNNTLYFQLPDGTITQEIPKEYKDISEDIKNLSAKEIHSNSHFSVLFLSKNTYFKLSKLKLLLS